MSSIRIFQTINSQDLVQPYPFPMQNSDEILTKAIEYRQRNLLLTVTLIIDSESGNVFESWLHDINAKNYVIAIRLWRSLETYLSVKGSSSWRETAAKREAYEVLIQYSVLMKTILPKDLSLLMSVLLMHSRYPPVFLYRYIQTRLAHMLKRKWQQFLEMDADIFHKSLSISKSLSNQKYEGNTEIKRKALNILSNLSEFG